MKMKITRIINRPRSLWREISESPRNPEKIRPFFLCLGSIGNVLWLVYNRLEQKPDHIIVGEVNKASQKPRRAIRILVLLLKNSRCSRVFASSSEREGSNPIVRRTVSAKVKQDSQERDLLVLRAAEIYIQRYEIRGRPSELVLGFSSIPCFRRITAILVNGRPSPVNDRTLRCLLIYVLIYTYIFL